MDRSVEFFERQFRRQVEAAAFDLNPFERAALPYVEGRTLDLGCGLGNLALAAARRGCDVTALDASPAAIERIRSTAAAEGLAVHARLADLRGFQIQDDYDTIVSIGLLMFFPEAEALALLANLQAHVRPGGCAIVNVLIEGTTFRDMFTPGAYYLFRPGELAERFAGWDIELQRQERFPAPGETVKAFCTVVARKRVAPAG